MWRDWFRFWQRTGASATEPSVSFHSLQMSTYCFCMAVQAMCKEGLAAVTNFAAIGPRRRHNGRRLYAAPPTGDGFR